MVRAVSVVGGDAACGYYINRISADLTPRFANTRRRLEATTARVHFVNRVNFEVEAGRIPALVDQTFVDAYTARFKSRLKALMCVFMTCLQKARRETDLNK